MPSDRVPGNRHPDVGGAQADPVTAGPGSRQILTDAEQVIVACRVQLQLRHPVAFCLEAGFEAGQFRVFRPGAAGRRCGLSG